MASDSFEPSAFPSGKALQALLFYIERRTGLGISIHDPLDLFQSIPELALPYTLKIHRSPICMLAKSTKQGLAGCLENKQTVADLMHRRRKSLCGMCHLGLTEWVQPILFHSRCVGSLYYGPFVVTEAWSKSLERIDSYCRQRQIDMSPYYEALSRMPKISRQQLPGIREEVRACVTIIEGLLEAWNPPLKEFLKAHHLYELYQNKPFLARQAMELIHQRPEEPWNVQTLAIELKCSPNYLGSVFQKYIGCKLTSYLRDARIHRAKLLLRAGRFNITETAAMCGFESPNQFNRAFHSVTGMSPRDFMKLPHAEAP